MDTITALSNPPAERTLVGMAIMRPDSYDDSRCEPGDFEQPTCREAWTAIGALRAAGHEVTVISVLDQLRRTSRQGSLDAPALLSMASEAPHTRPESIGKIVRSAALARRLERTCSETLMRVREESADVEDALASHRSQVGDMDCRSGEDPEHLGGQLAGVLDTIEARASKREGVAVPTGIKAFDSAIGGLRPKTVTVIAARPGQGKSALAKGICIAAARQGIPVLIFSLEMAMQEQAERILGSEANVNLGRITSGRLEYAEYRRLTESAKSVSELPIWVYDQHVRLDRMESITRRWYARHVAGQGKKLALWVCDYIGLVASSERKGNREQEVAAISQASKRLAMSREHPGLACINVAQLNRRNEQEQRDPRASDLRESGSVEQDADMIIFPIRDVENEDNYGKGPARILVAKNRGGPTGEIKAYWSGPYTRFEDVDATPADDDHSMTSGESPQ